MKDFLTNQPGTSQSKITTGVKTFMGQVALALGLWLCAVMVHAQVTPLKSNYDKLSNMPLNSTPVSHILTTADIGTTGQLSPDHISNRISLAICEEENLCAFNGAVTLSVKVTIEYKLLSAPNTLQTLNDVELTISYNPQTGESYIEKSTFLLTDAFEVNIIPTYYSTSNSTLLNALCLYNDMDFIRRWDMSQFYTIAPSLQSSLNSATHQIEITWTQYDWATEYDLEWIWVDDYNLPGQTPTYLAATNVNFNFTNNWERVTLKTNSYTITDIFEHGYVIFRVRGVGYGGTGYAHRIPANWSLPYQSGTADQVIQNYANDIIAITNTVSHQYLMNWQYQASYAEDGKKKEVVSYFDGSLHNRQSVTINNSEQMAMVAETFYDHAGRPAVSVLPAPAFSSVLGYYMAFTLNSNNNPLTAADFDRDAFTSFCNTPSQSLTLSNQAGASKYYSPNNPEVANGFNQYIPDAQLYPYTQVEYMPDNTGRVRRQGGVGATRTLGAGKETQYQYVVPEQMELDRLFGTNVGYAQHYSKNVVRDANGQASISYMNARGEVIATALTGEVPTNLDALNSNTTIAMEVNLLEDAPTSSRPEDLVLNRDVYVEKNNSTYLFKYELTSEELSTQCPADFCYDCVYDLEISLLDECNMEHMPNGVPLVRTIGRQPDGSFGMQCNTIRDYKFSQDNLLTVDNNGFITITGLQRGTYKLVKRLTVNQDALKFYTDEYIKKLTEQNCIPTEQELITAELQKVNLSRCSITCEECRDMLGTQTQYINNYNASLTRTPTQDDIDYATEMYNIKLANCDAYCNTTDKCRSYFMTLLAQVSPGGQYALVNYNQTNNTYTVTPQSFSIFAIGDPNRSTNFSAFNTWVNSIQFDQEKLLIDGQFKQVNQFTAKELYEKWQPEWAYTFVKLHPEYCHYLKCKDEQLSNAYDEEMLRIETYDEAFQAGYLNPLNSTGNIGTGTPQLTYQSFTPSPCNNCGDPYFSNKATELALMKIALESLQVVSSVYLSAWHVMLEDICAAQTSNPTAFLNCINGFFTTSGISNCVTEESRNKAWQLFRAFYLTNKRKIEKASNDAGCATGTALVNSMYDASNYQLHIVFPTDLQIAKKFGFNSGNKDDYATNRGKAQQMLSEQCSTQCNSYAWKWKEQLKGCLGTSFSESQLDALVADMVKVCRGGCDENNPLGSSAVVKQNQFNSAYPYKSFKEVFIGHGITNFTTLCTPDLINFPGKPGHDYFLENTNGVNPRDFSTADSINGVILVDYTDDHCVCESFNSLDKQYQDWSQLPNNSGCTSFHAYLNTLYKTNYTAADIELLRKACRFRPSGGGAHECDEVIYPLPVNNGNQIIIDDIPENIPQVPVGWTCTRTIPRWGDKLCLTCYDVANEALLFKEKYNNFPIQGYQLPALYANIINTKEGFNLTYPEFLDFLHSCNDIFQEFFDADIYNLNGASELPQFVDGFMMQTPMDFEPGGNVITDPQQAGTCACNRIYYIYLKWMELKQNSTLLPEHEKFEDFAQLYGLDIRSDENGGTYPLEALIGHCSLLKDMMELLELHTNGDDTTYTLKYCNILKLLKGADKACQIAVDCDVVHEAIANIEAPVTAQKIKNALISIYGGGNKFHVISGTVPVFPCSTETCPTEELFAVCSDLTKPAMDFFDIMNMLAQINTSQLGTDNFDLNGLLAYLKSGFNPMAELNGCENNGHNQGNPKWRYSRSTVTVNGTDHIYDYFGIEQNGTNCQFVIEDPTYVVTDVRRFKNVVPLTVFGDGKQRFSCEIEVMVNGILTTISATGFTTCFPISECCAPNRFLCNEPLFPQMNPISPCQASLIKAATANAKMKYKELIADKRQEFENNYMEHCLQAAPNEVFEMKYDMYAHHVTLYYYDQAGNLMQTVPPAGVHPITSSTDLHMVAFNRRSNPTTQLLPAHTLPTQYRFGTLNQLLWQKTPDANESNFFYDRLARLIFSQNKKQAVNSSTNQHIYSYIRYDGLGRVNEGGEILTSTSISYTNSRDAAAMDQLYSSSTLREITHTYYDNEVFTVNTGMFTQQYLRGRVAHSTYSRVQPTSNPPAYDAAVHYSYDILGNVSSLVRENKSLDLPLGQSLKQVDYAYDLISGKTNKVSYQPGGADAFYHRYLYDADNRLTDVYTSTDDIHWDRDARYSYYRHGPLARTELGQRSVQGVDYAYTLQGWLKGVNSSTLVETRDIGQDGYMHTSNIHRNVARDVYGFTLSYYNNVAADYTPINVTALQAGNGTFEAVTVNSGFSAASPDLFNGNIKSMVVAIAKFMENNAPPLGYAYSYDQLNRLKTVNTWNNINASANSWNSNGSALNDYHNSFTYDANGNILTQERKGSTASGLGLDDLTYHYVSNTNQLDYVSDAIGSSAYADDIDNQGSGNYDYDEIGNLVKDVQEEIADIEWTMNGKIRRITRSSGSQKPDLEFAYSPDGHRICKIVKPKTGAHLWQYTYYVHDAQGNILATYNRELEAIFDPEKVSFELTNSALVSIEGGAEFSNFIQTLHPLSNTQFVLDLKSRLLAGGYEQQFIKHFSPSGILNSNATLFQQVYQQFPLIPVVNAISNIYGIDALFEQGCNSYGSAFIQYCMDADPNHFLTFLDNNYPGNPGNTPLEDMYTAAGGLGPNPGTVAMVNYLLANWTTSQMANWMSANLSCSTFKWYMLQMYGVPQLEQLLYNYPLIRDVLQALATTQQLIDAMMNHNLNLLWDLMYQNSSAGYLLDEIYNTELSFYNVLLQNYWMVLGPQQEQQQPYTRTQYYNYIQQHFPDAYNELVSMFLYLSNHFKDRFVLDEWHMYGSNRLGVQKAGRKLIEKTFDGDWDSYAGSFSEVENLQVTEYSADPLRTELTRGNKRYELVNHLGNVLVVITDKKLPNCTESSINHYTAELMQATDYSAFGVQLNQRVYCANTEERYRFGFNGKENDNEVKGDGNEIVFEARVFDPRLGKWLSTDPREGDYPWQSAYAYFMNSPISILDQLGEGGGKPEEKVVKAEVLDYAMDDFQNKAANLNEIANKLMELKAAIDHNQKIIDEHTGWAMGLGIQGLLYRTMFLTGIVMQLDYMAGGYEAKQDQMVTAYNALCDEYQGAYSAYNASKNHLKSLVNSVTAINIGGVLVHKNSNTAVGNFAIYEFEIDGQHYKFGVADANRQLTQDVTVQDPDGKPVTIKKGTPIRIYQQQRSAIKQFKSVNVTYEVHYNVTKLFIKTAETEKVLKKTLVTGVCGDGNTAHAKKYNLKQAGRLPKKLK